MKLVVIDSGTCKPEHLRSLTRAFADRRHKLCASVKVRMKKYTSIPNEYLRMRVFQKYFTEDKNASFT